MKNKTQTEPVWTWSDRLHDYVANIADLPTLISDDEPPAEWRSSDDIEQALQDEREDSDLDFYAAADKALYS